MRDLLGIFPFVFCSFCRGFFCRHLFVDFWRSRNGGAGYLWNLLRFFACDSSWRCSRRDILCV